LGQKAHPYGLRLGIIKSWKSKWFTTRNYADLLHEDLLIRRYTYKRLEHAGIAEVEILRAPKKVTIDIHTARPGIVIGRKGAEVDTLKEELQLLTGKEILLNVIEIKKPEISSSLVAQSIAKQLEGRVSFRRAMKKAMAAAMKSGAEGIKISCGGRLGGAEIARTEKYHDGRVPLHTLRADIDYSTATAHTTYGTIGVKVWICKGEIFGEGVTSPESPREAPVVTDDRPSDARRKRPHHKRPSGPGGGHRDGDRKPSARDLNRAPGHGPSRPSDQAPPRPRPEGQQDQPRKDKPHQGPAKNEGGGKS
jgi:small subunit ribosomal protein S3